VSDLLCGKDHGAKCCGPQLKTRILFFTLKPWKLIAEGNAPGNLVLSFPDSHPSALHQRRIFTPWSVVPDQLRILMIRVT
jgi:hypothetical protein